MSFPNTPWCAPKTHLKLCFMLVLNLTHFLVCFFFHKDVLCHTFWCITKDTFSCIFKTHLTKYSNYNLHLHKLFAQNIRSDRQMVIGPVTNNYFHTKFSNNCTYNNLAFWYEMAFYHTKYCLVVTNCLKRQINEQFLSALNGLYRDNVHWRK